MWKFALGGVIGFFGLTTLLGGSFGAGLFLLALGGGLIWWAMSSRGGGGRFSDPVSAAMAARDQAVAAEVAQRAPLLEQLKTVEMQKAREAIRAAKARTQELEWKWV